MTVKRPLPALALVLVATAAVSVLSVPAHAAGGPSAGFTGIELSPEHPSPFDRILVRLGGSGGCFLPPDFAFDPPIIDGDTITLATPFPIGGCELPNPWSTQVTLGPLAAGTYTLRAVFEGIVDGEITFEVGSPGPRLSLHGGRFLVFLEFSDPRDRGLEKSAQSVRLSDQSGYFWFFDSSNVEVTLKLLDGRALNGHFWIFVGSMTTVPYRLTVIDQSLACLLPPCPNERVFRSTAGKNENFIDLGAF